MQKVKSWENVIRYHEYNGYDVARETDELKMVKNIEVSIIITCRDRREFLLDALRSISNQKADRDSYEVIIVKNFKDNNVEEFCKKNNYTTLLSDKVTQGELTAEGIKYANGRVLSFLDDDDTFSEDKVSALLEIFSDQDVVFYHNAHRLIDETGNPQTGYKVKPPKKDIRIISNSAINLRKILKENDLYHIGTFYFNLSSISILRETATTNLKFLENLIGRPDDFFFFAALTNFGKTLVIGKEELTLYRDHTSASNPVWSEENVKKLRTRHLASSKIILEMLKETTLSHVVKYSIVLPQIDLYKANNDLIGYLKSLFPYIEAMRINNFPMLYILTNYILGMLECTNVKSFKKARIKFLGMIRDISS